MVKPAIRQTERASIALIATRQAISQKSAGVNLPTTVPGARHKDTVSTIALTNLRRNPLRGKESQTSKQTRNKGEEQRRA